MVTKKKVNTKKSVVAKKTNTLRNNTSIKTTYLKSISIENFLKIPAFYKNRDVLSRVNKKRKELEKGFLPSHLNVVIGIAKKSFHQYQQGDMFVVDGNTRAEVWRQYPELRPMVTLNATYMNFEDKDTLESTYYSIDSASAYEKSNEKLSGIFREIDFNPVSKIVRQGKIKTALDDAAAYLMYINGKPKKDATIEDIVRHYIVEIKYIDSIIDKVNKKKYSSTLFACMMMIGKKYGVNSERFQMLCHNIINNIYEKAKDTHICGIQYVMDELYTANNDIWKVTGLKKGSELISEMLFALEQYMQGKQIKRKENYKIAKTKKYIQHYVNYFS